MPVVDLELVRGLYKTAGAVRLKLDIAPRFKPGDHVVARNINPPGHTRLPRYIRNKRGFVERDHGVFHLPDARVAGQVQLLRGRERSGEPLGTAARGVRIRPPGQHGHRHGLRGTAQH